MQSKDDCICYPRYVAALKIRAIAAAEIPQDATQARGSPHHIAARNEAKFPRRIMDSMQ
jgi:hypothetical protein